MPEYDTFPEKEDDTYRPSYPYTEKVETNVTSIQYGDGYEKIVPIGLNYKRLEFEVTWDNIRYNFTNDLTIKEDGNIIYEFLSEHQAAKPFWWRKLPNDKYRLVVAKETTLTHTAFNLVSISCKMVEFKGHGDMHEIGDVVNESGK